jgi:hypothetical protein
MTPSQLRTQLIDTASLIDSKTGFEPHIDFERYIRDAASTRNLHDREAYDAAHKILAHMNRQAGLCAIRGAD